MNQADLSRLIPRINVKLNPNYRRLKNKDGPVGRLLKLRKTVTALVKHERIECTENRADEARAYAELLIMEAMRYGDCHNHTMKMADYWLLEKQLVHKLFKVLVPRYHQSEQAVFTRLLRIPSIGHQRVVLELKGNPYPSLLTDMTSNRNLIQNVLLDEARREYRKKKYEELALKMAPVDAVSTEETETTS